MTRLCFVPFSPRTGIVISNSYVSLGIFAHSSAFENRPGLAAKAPPLGPQTCWLVPRPGPVLGGDVPRLTNHPGIQSDIKTAKTDQETMFCSLMRK